MKMRPADYAALKAAVLPSMEQLLETDYRAAGLSPMRWRWDCLRHSKVKIGDGVGVPGDLNLYAYCNDTHIDTALRKIATERRTR